MQDENHIETRWPEVLYTDHQISQRRFHKLSTSDGDFSSCDLLDFVQTDPEDLRPCADSPPQLFRTGCESASLENLFLVYPRSVFVGPLTVHVVDPF